jgi:hypothetical protein
VAPSDSVLNDALLGTGGDDSNGSDGSFFEGVITVGYPSTPTDNAVQANIVATGYRQGACLLPRRRDAIHHHQRQQRHRP